MAEHSLYVPPSQMSLPFWCSPSEPDDRYTGPVPHATESVGPATPLRHGESVDHEIIQRITQGDAAALDMLVTRYAADLTHFAAALVHSADLAHDVVQDVFIKLWERRATLVVRENVGGYLLRMTRNRALDTLRHERSQTRISTIVGADLATRPAQNDGEQAVETAELATLVRAAVNDLPPRLREVLLMRRQSGMSSAQVADALGITSAAVQVHLSRALRRIALYLAERLD